MNSSNVITSSDEVTPEWLTDILGQPVTHLEKDITTRELSTVINIAVTYKDGASGPEHVFLKMVTIDMEDEFFGPSETNYYRRDYVDVPDAPIPTCYSAEYSEELGRYHILLDDVSKTHHTAKNIIPDIPYANALSKGLAALHAPYWGQKNREPLPDANDIENFIKYSRSGAEHILNSNVANHLEPHWPDLIRDIFAHHPALMEQRTKNPNGFTLIHGDVNWHNILIHKYDTEPLFIVDRQPFNWSLTTWLGVYDLTYANILNWDIDVRRALQEPMLKVYHEELQKRGITDYTWDQLWEDYRLSVVMGIYVSTEWCREAVNYATMDNWLTMLKSTLTAVDDLKCAELWA